MPWSWYGLSNNPNITFDIMEANSDKPWVHYRYLIDDRILAMPFDKVISTMRNFMATRTIQRAFKEAYYNPEHKFCRNRLQREFTGMAPVSAAIKS